MSHRLNSLEFLRVLAASLVFFVHLGGFGSVPGRLFLGSDAIFIGAIGVDIFFVISGIVMYQSARRALEQPHGALGFLINRFLRIFPLYIIATLLYAWYQAGLGKPFALYDIAMSLTLLPYTTPEGWYPDPILMPAWSMRFELFFYIAVAVSIWLRRILIGPGLILLAAVGLWLLNGFFLGVPLVLEFALGYYMAHWMETRPARPGRRETVGYAAALLGTVTLMLLAIMGRDYGFSGEGPWYNINRIWVVYPDGTQINRLFAWGMPAALLVYLCVRLEERVRWPLAGLGKYTYSAYLLQPMFLGAFEAIRPMPPELFRFLLAWGGLFLLAAASYHGIEKPGIILGKRLVDRLGRRGGVPAAQDFGGQDLDISAQPNATSLPPIQTR